MKSAAILHGAGYVGSALIESVLSHPEFNLAKVTSRSQAGQPVHGTHPHLRGQCNLSFEENLGSHDGLEVIFVAAAHGQGAQAVGKLRNEGYEGLIVDMSADFRLEDAQTYLDRYGIEHPRPDLLEEAWYGLPEITGAPPIGIKLIANPGCFATAISLALHPLSKAGLASSISITAMTGASGSGIQAKAGTHFPSRAGNLRAYKVLSHQHEAEIRQMAPGLDFTFVPVSGPWTAGIWGTAQFSMDEQKVGDLYDAAYGDKSLIRLWPGQIPELHWSVGSAFTDIGWIQKGEKVVVGFALDNLMKGAATQAVQNVNLAFGFEETMGLLNSQS